MTQTTIKTLELDLYNDLFVGFTRRTYQEQYTAIPTEAYSPQLRDLMTALASALGQDPETTPLTIVSQDSYAQRVVGPKVYRTESGQLVGRYAKELVPVSFELIDDEPIYKVNDVTCSLATNANGVDLVIPLGKGRKALVPFHLEQGVVPKAAETQLVGGDFSSVSQLKTGGSRFFSALKHLPVGKYQILNSEQQSNGLYGPKTKIQILSGPEPLTLACSTKNPDTGKWETQQVEVSPNSQITVDANTKLSKLAMGQNLKGNTLHIIDVTTDPTDNKTYVNANIEFREAAAS